MDNLFQHGMHMNGGIDERRKRKLEESTDVLKAMTDAKRLSPGMVVSQGTHSLDNLDLLEAINARREE